MKNWHNKMSQEKIQELQLTEQHLQSIHQQKNKFQTQLFETESAIYELANTKIVHKIIGNVMVLADKDKIKKELLEKKEVLELRLKTIEKQEKTLTEKAAILQLGKELGIEDTRIDEEIKAAAIGSGVDIYNPSGVLVVDIGGGTTDFGVLSLGDVVLSRSIKVAGTYFDDRIIEYVKDVHKLEIGTQTAEKAKIHLASLSGDLPVDETGKLLTFEVMGRNVTSGLPKMVVLEPKEIRDILLKAFETIKQTLG